jgi:prophage tail gpP-like protein
MPTPADNVQLLIGGQMHDRWESYEIDSDLLTPADCWRVTLGMTDGQMPPAVVPGATVEVRIGADTVLTGRVDEVEHDVSKTAHRFTLSGRDRAADLVDCSAPVFAAELISLKAIVAKIVSEFGIAKVKIEADATRIREKINIEPGDSAWDALVHAAEANGLWSWFEPDGTLVVGGPDYTTPVVASLILRRNGQGNNVLSLSKQESMHGRYSEVTVFGQKPGTDQEQGKNNLRGSWKDDGVKWHRPKIAMDHECDNVAVCIDRAHKMISDSRLNGLTLCAVVKGHRIVADGLLWKPGQRVHVISEPHNLDGVYFLMGRKFTRSRAGGTITELTLKEDGIWVTDAHPHKNKHRRGKNSLPGQIITVGGAS